MFLQGDKGVDTFPESISLKGNIIADFELAYGEVKVQYFSHYATEIHV